MSVFQSFDIVIAGRFNPHIITPSWLIRTELAKESEPKVQLGFDPQSHSPSFRIQVDRVTWSTSDSRLELSAKFSDVDLSVPATAILKLLPHTPIQAVGHNFHFKWKIAEWSGRIPQLGEVNFEGLRQFGEPVNTTWTSGFRVDKNLVVQLQLVHSENSVEVHTNFHRDASNCEAGLKAVENFPHDFDRTKELIQKITGMVVEK